MPYIRFPAGEVVSGAAPKIHEALSSSLGEPVILAEEVEVSHLDAGPVHLLSSASLGWLQAALPNAHVDARRFRPNLVIELPGTSPVELQWVGKRLRVGQKVELEISASTERCGMVAFAQGELPDEPGVLRHVAKAAELRFGVYGQVVVPGDVRRHDVVALLEQKES